LAFSLTNELVGQVHLLRSKEGRLGKRKINSQGRHSVNKVKRVLTAAIAAGACAFASPAMADGGLTFQIAGDTFGAPYSITNTSTAGERVLGFGISLISPFGFDTVNGGFGVDNALAFSTSGGSALTTGYTGPASFSDGATKLDFTFSNFDVGETFTWEIDVDQPSIAAVIGNELIGSTGYADFSNGLRGVGTFQAFGSQGSQFVITSFTPTPAVPEPSTWAMMLLGFGFAGVAVRSTRRKGEANFAHA
jgi:hypothetical protein